MLVVVVAVGLGFVACYNKSYMYIVTFTSSVAQFINYYSFAKFYYVSHTT